MALTTQIQQITQLMTNPAPTPTVTLPLIPMSPSLVRPLSQMVTYLVCDELKYGFKSAYEQS